MEEHENRFKRRSTMHAAEINVEELFKSDNQLLVPLWQRRYAWREAQWRELWRDLLRVKMATEEGGPANHFVGSVVLHAQEGTGLPSEAHRYLIVDGQQRITTLTVVICAIRDHIARLAIDDAERNRIRELYTSRYLRNTNLAPDFKERLVLQEPDRAALAILIEGGELSATSLVGEAYRYFSAALAEMSSDEALALLTHISKRMSAVWVVLEPGDNAHRVFQTLNSGGKQLDQSDLVRNYFFLLLGEKGDAFYEAHWKNLEADVPTNKLQSYLAAWTISQGHVGSKGSLFAYFQSDLNPSEYTAEAVFEYGVKFVEASRLYRKLLVPTEFSAASAETKGSLRSLARWGTDPAEGLLLYLLRRLEGGAISDALFGEACEIVLSYLARRFLAGYAPNRHRSIFVRITQRLLAREDLIGEDLVNYLRALLSDLDGENVWPSNAFLAERVHGTPVYTEARRKWVFIVLERLNRTYFHYAANAPEWIDDASYTVEHILPQRPAAAWAADLASWGHPSVSELIETHVHVLGNLTLSATNPQLSNKRFVEKQAIYADDTLKLNDSLLSLARWAGEEIDARGIELATRAADAFIRPLSRFEIDALEFFNPDEDALPADEPDDLGESDDRSADDR